jgi:hypothetical protein
MREEKARSRRQLVEEKQLLLLAEYSVVALLGLLDHDFVLLHQLGVREGDTVHALQGVVGSAAEPVRGRRTQHLKRFHSTCVRHVRTAAQINERAAAVRSGVAAIGNFVGNDLHLECVVGEHPQGLLFAQDDALESLLLLDDSFSFGVDLLVLGFCQRAAVASTERLRDDNKCATTKPLSPGSFVSMQTKRAVGLTQTARTCLPRTCRSRNPLRWAGRCTVYRRNCIPDTRPKCEQTSARTPANEYDVYM